MNANTPHIDFEYWSILAKNDPRQFELLRSATLRAALHRASEVQRQRLQSLQWRLDQVRGNAKTPLAACIKMSGMMWDSFHQLNQSYQYPPAQPSLKPSSLATVIVFPRCR